MLYLPVEDRGSGAVGVEVVVSFVPSAERLGTVGLLATEAVSGVEGVRGVEGSVGGWLVYEDFAESDFIRIRRACSSTSWAMTPWAWVRSLVYTSYERCHDRWIYKETNRDEDVAISRCGMSSVIQS